VEEGEGCVLRRNGWLQRKAAAHRDRAERDAEGKFRLLLLHQFQEFSHVPFGIERRNGTGRNRSGGADVGKRV
jgi:hypothetical protein